MAKIGSKKHNDFIKEHFVTCECGYNNKKNRLQAFGTCLACGKILDEKAYFKRNIREKMFARKK